MSYMRDSKGRRLDSFEVLGKVDAEARYATGIGERLRRAAARSLRNNSLELPVATTLPTITASSSNNPLMDANIATNYRVTAGQAGSFLARGGTPVVYSTTFWRFPTVTISAGGPGNIGTGSTQNAIGWAIEFMSDAPKLLLDFLGSSSGIGIMIEVDGQRLSAASIQFDTPSAQEKWFMLDWAGVRKVRHYRLEGKDAHGFRGVATSALDKVWAPPSGKPLTLTVNTDSLGAQQGVNLPNGGFAYSLGKLLGFTDTRSVSLGGTGYINQSTWGSTIGDAVRVADVVATNPDLVLICGSSNDSGQSNAAITAAALAAFRAHRAALPKVPIVVGGVWGGSTGPVAGWIAVETAVKAAFDTWADPNSFFVPVSTDPTGAWVTGTGHIGATTGSGNADIYVNAADTTHPSPAGHDYLAMRYATAIRALVYPLL